MVPLIFDGCELRAVFRDDQRIDWKLSRLLVRFELESVGQQRLHHPLLLVRACSVGSACNCASTEGPDFASMSNMMEPSQAGPPRICELGSP